MIWSILACAVSEPTAPVQPAVSAPVEAAAPTDVAAWRKRPLGLTHHGRCRMACRHFDQGEVEQILAEGRLVPERTRLDGRCPTHALEGTTRDGQRARMVFAACDDEARLVTAIDLDTEWPCDCQ